MTKTTQAKAIIIGSYCMYLISALLDKSEQNNLTTIRLKQTLIAKTRVKDYLPYVEMSNLAWQKVIEQFKDDNMHIVIFDAVESLVFDNTDIMVKMYGKNIIPYTSAFSMKQASSNMDTKLLKESRIITDALKKSVEKIVFENKKDL